MEGKGQAADRHVKPKHVIVAAIIALVMLAMLGGCQPNVAGQSEGHETSGDPLANISNMADFTNRSVGDFPDTAWNEIYINAGNRGCNACHESLDDVMLIGAKNHPIERMGNTSTNNITILDCKSCHDLHSGDYGMYYGDTLHAAHYGSAQFTETLHGNCWSCHAMTDAAELTDTGNWDIKLWEDVKYDAGVGGFPDLPENAYTDEFLQFLGHPSGNNQDMDVDHAPKFDVTMSQEVTEDLNDAFTALNHNGVYHEEDLYDKSHTVSLVGVKNPREFSWDDLKAMPQVTKRSTIDCLVAGSAGHNIYNAEWTGVPISYLVEQCGGLEEGMNQAGADAWDGWVNAGIKLPIHEYIDEGLVALQINGEDLPYEFGGPIRMILPGTGGGQNTSWVKTIEFTHSDEEPTDFIKDTFPYLPEDELNPVSAAWFANDGATFSLSDGVDLKGYAHAYAMHMGSPLAAIEFSTDYGLNWQRFDIPKDSDPYQWVNFNFHWDPPAAGTYVVKVHGVNTEGLVNETDAGIIVKVTE